MSLDKGRIRTVHPVVVQHQHPEQRERRDNLGHAARVAALGQALWQPGVVVMVYRLSHQTVIAGEVERDERLDAGVAHVLELLVVGAVEIVLAGAETGRAPGHVPDRGQRGIVAGECGVELERVAGERVSERVDRERLGGGDDIHLQVAERAEPEGEKAPVRAAVRQELVIVAEHVHPVDLVPVVLVAGGVHQGLGPDQADQRALTARDAQLGVDIGQVALVDQQADPAVGRNIERLAPVQESLVRSDAAGAADVSRRLGAFLHCWDGPRHEIPVAVIHCAPRSGGLLDGQWPLPAGIVEIRPDPAPGVQLPVHPVTRPHGLETQVVVYAVLHDIPSRVERRERLVRPRFPGLGAGVGRSLQRPVPLQQECGPAGHLGEWHVVTVVPDQGGQDIAAGPEPGGQIHAFVAPVVRVPAPRPLGGLDSVDIQTVTVVGADMHKEFLRGVLQLEGPPKQADPVVPGRDIGAGDPAGWPDPVQQVGGGLGRERRGFEQT